MSRRTRPRKASLKTTLGGGSKKLQRPLYSEAEEDNRAQALGLLGVLDTQPEERFDRICRLAQGVLNVPATYISYLDRDRQWFKSTLGMGEVKETPRAGSFCDYAIRRSRPTVVLNADADPFFKESPYVTEGPKVKFYAGFPLMFGDQRVGTLCALDFEPRDEITDQQMQQLFELARIAEREMSSGWDGQTVAKRLPVSVLKAYIGEEDQLDQLDPEVVMALLNLYFEMVVAIVERWEGSVDQMTGGSFSLVFHGPQHEMRAAACALEIQNSTPELNKQLESRELPTISVGMGLHSQDMILGFLEAGGLQRATLAGTGRNKSELLVRKASLGEIAVSSEFADKLKTRATFEQGVLKALEVGE